MSHGFAREPKDIAENILINGGPTVFQRQIGTETTLTSYADDAYCTADRWYVLTQTTTIQTARGTGDINRYSIQLKQNQASGQRMGLAQIVEASNSIPYQGQTVRFQFRFKVSNDQDIRVAILEWTGTADSVTSDFVNDWTSTTYTAGDFFTTTSTTVTNVKEYASPGTGWVDAYIDATVGTSCNNLVVLVWTEGTAAQNVTLDLECMDLHVGQYQRDWDPRPMETEELLCRRYFETLASLTAFTPFGSGLVKSTSTAEINLVYIPKRITPTGTVSAESEFRGYDGASAVQLTVMTIYRQGNRSCGLAVTQGGTTWTAGRGFWVDSNNNTTARIYLDSEL